MGDKGPRRGSLAYWHRKRAAKLVPNIRAWNKTVKGLAGFCGYKAGMAQVTFIDDRETPTKGQEIVRPVTLVEVPPVFIYAVVGYAHTSLGLKNVGEVPTTNAPKEFKRAHTLAKKSAKTIEDLKKLQLAEVRVVAMSMPWKSGIGKKQSEVMEIALGGTPAEALDFAAGVLGKEIAAKDVLQEGEFVDVVAVTKGKGWQGIVKRFGVALNPHKATQSRRHGGSIGPERQAKVMYTIPRPGQMGFHRRTDRNKRIFRISDDSKDFDFVHNYGKLKTTYLIVDGSIPGPAKRFVLLRKPFTGIVVKKPELKQILK